MSTNKKTSNRCVVRRNVLVEALIQIVHGLSSHCGLARDDSEPNARVGELAARRVATETIRGKVLRIVKPFVSVVYSR